MTEPLRPADQTTIEDIDPPTWDNTAAVPNPVPAEAPAATAAPASRGRSRGVRWIVALLGVVVVIAGSAVVVSLAAGRPAPSVAMGYMPADAVIYTEARLDLPGDQRQKLGAFLSKALPGFDDQAQLDTKLNDVLDRLVRSASDGKQTWTTDIQPWFGGQLAVGVRLPDLSAFGPGSATTITGTTDSNGVTVLGAPVAATTPGMGSLDSGLFVATIKDRAKAEAWLASVGDKASTNKTTYNGADLYENADKPGAALAVTDSVILGGSTASVKAAVDTNGKGSFASNEDVKAALATIDQDNVGLTIVRTKTYVDGLIKMIGSSASDALAKTQLDDAVLGMLPAWQASSIRFENDALAATSSSPAWKIGYHTANHASRLTGHVPAKTVAYAEVHDVGQVLKAIIDTFRALPETKSAFDSFDQALALVGGYQGLFGWWGDAAIAVTPLADGTLGGGLVVEAKDAEAAKRLLGTLTTGLQLAGGGSGVTVRTEDHAGTTITIADLSGVAGMPKDLPKGYKAEIAWASNADIAVIGYGRDFVAAVLDAKPGSSLADDARFKGLVDRVGAQNISLGYLDIAGIRGLIEPLVQKEMAPEKWAEYQKEYKPYLEHFDALIGAVHKDGSVDLGSSQLTVK
jgi:hypothetical protein